MNGKALAKKARTIGTVVLVVYAVTVATNLGEFWPFSIYPMFSQGGNNWSRSLVREFPEDDSTSWEVVGLADVPGAPFSVKNESNSERDIFDNSEGSTAKNNLSSV